MSTFTEIISTLDGTAQTADQVRVAIGILLEKLEIVPLSMMERNILDRKFSELMRLYDIREDSSTGKLVSKRWV